MPYTYCTVVSDPNPSRYEIALYWQGRGKYVMIDFGEPSCWACSYYEPEWECEEGESLRSMWNRIGLERAHLVPASLGGQSSPSNMVLLCPLCHKDAPDHADPQYMIRWIESREDYFGWAFRSLATAINELGGISKEDAALIIGHPRMDEAFKTAYERATWHFGAGRFTPCWSTRAAVAIEAISLLRQWGRPLSPTLSLADDAKPSEVVPWLTAGIDGTQGTCA